MSSTRKEKSHEAILRGADRLSKERGFDGAGVADVMDTAGLTVGGFYAHFDSKEDMLREAVVRSVRKMWPRLVASAEGESGRERAENVARIYVTERHRAEVGKGCAVPALLSEIGRRDPRFRSAFAVEIDALANELGEALAHGRRALGEAPPRRTKRRKERERAVALTLFAMMQGAIALSRATRGTPISDEVLKAAREFGPALAGVLDAD